MRTPEQIVESEIHVCLSYLVSDLTTLYWKASGIKGNPFDENDIANLTMPIRDSIDIEHWAVSNWLAKKLVDHGERVVELSGVNIWCRTTTGQDIFIDDVIEEIAKETGWTGRCEACGKAGPNCACEPEYYEER